MIRKQYHTRSLVASGIISSIYIVLTMVFRPISFGAVQFRISEVLTLLPIFTVDAVPGLFIGCFLANILGGGIWFDVALGSLATLLAAVCTRRFRHRPMLAAIFPTVFNGIIVGPVVYFAYVHAPGTSVIAPPIIS